MEIYVIRSKDVLQKKYERTEQKKEHLKLDMEAIEKDKSQIALTLAEQKRLSEKLMDDVEKLGGQSTLEQIESLKMEIKLLNQEIKTLTKGLLQQELYGAAYTIDKPVTEVVCRFESPPLSLRVEQSNLRDDMDEEQDGEPSLKG